MSVISLNGKPVSTSVNDEVVKDIEQLLVDAKSGRIVGVMWVALRQDGRSWAGWSNAPDGYSYGLGLHGLNYKFGKSAWDDE